MSTQLDLPIAPPDDTLDVPTDVFCPQPDCADRHAVGQIWRDPTTDHLPWRARSPYQRRPRRDAAAFAAAYWVGCSASTTSATTTPPVERSAPHRRRRAGLRRGDVRPRPGLP